MRHGRRPLSIVALMGSLFAVLLLWTITPGQAAAKEQRLHGQGRLWQITRGDTTPSHVFGTMHSTDEAVIDVPAAIRKAIVRSERLVLELKFGEEFEGQMAQAMILTDGRQLQDIIGAKLFRRLEQAAARYGLPAQRLNLFRPWAVTMMLGMPPAEMARQAEGQLVLDQVLQNYAEANAMPVFALEKPDEQIAALSAMSHQDQMALLSVSITLNRRIDGVFKNLKEAYLKGDLDALHDMARKLSAGTDARLFEQYKNNIIDRRNHQMADRAVEHLDKGGAFIAVGALHLSGKVGLLHLLEKKGYTVKRVL